MNPSLDIFGRNSWLDSFFDEFMELTGPTMQQCHGNSSGGGGGGGGSSSSTRTHAFDAATMTTTGASPSQSSDARPSPQSQTSVRPWSDSVIDRTVRSDDLDELLVRWSPIYETYLCAIFDTSKPAGDAPLMDRLMDVTRTDNTCKASMVACCLAYRDVIERELQCARPPSRFVRYMLHGSGSDGGGKGVGGGSRARTKGGDSCQRCSCHSSWTEERPTHLASSASHFAHAWLRFAHDGFERTKAGMPIATKLLTLLNIRYASVCLLGARDSFALAPDIHAALTEVEVDIDYLYDTYKCGTTLSFMVQALAFANAMDAATIRGARSAIRDHAPASGSTVLSRDSAVNPLADYCYVTMLSVGLLECIKRISDLAADIDEGRVLLKADVDARSERIQDLIMVCFLFSRKLKDIKADETKPTPTDQRH
ncbi:hypothetical protein FA10DRAFT_268970 [Acaromyces ingoldii]|uniref:Uncharacterized protein n=1 Tax=Acaromyces ingoldii TaxID=215250 RepID=A0A316YDZ9_9BASI|nr:hypothetical protein FA10DRAFT_268970 [Acaromyces ingoldii]PWN87637.1 hypothetical protein FA10DRAFT_268970 [Acaromyces ingoldii]